MNTLEKLQSIKPREVVIYNTGISGSLQVRREEAQLARELESDGKVVLVQRKLPSDEREERFPGTIPNVFEWIAIGKASA